MQADHGDEISRLQRENARLIALLDANGIDWREPAPLNNQAAVPTPQRLKAEQRVALFANLFRGRVDVFPVRWESKTTGSVNAA